MSTPSYFFPTRAAIQTSADNDLWAKIGGKYALPDGEETGNALVYDASAERWILTGTASTGSLTLGNGTNVAGAGLGTVALGQNAGGASTAAASVFIGDEAGVNAFGNNGIVAVGAFAGANLGDNAIAIGVGANNDQSGDNEENTIAIGVNTAQNGQKANAIAIGANAAQGNIQDENSIVINASGSTNTSAGAGTCVITPIRNVVQNGNPMYYDPTTGEVFCSSSAPNGDLTVWITAPVAVPNTFNINVGRTIFSESTQVFTAACATTDFFDLRYTNGRFVLVLSVTGTVYATSNNDGSGWVLISTTGLNMQCLEWIPYLLNDTAVGGFWVTAGSNPANSRVFYSNNGVNWSPGVALTGGSITQVNILTCRWVGGMTMFGGWYVNGGTKFPCIFYSYDAGRSTYYQQATVGTGGQVGKAVQSLDSDGTTILAGLSVIDETVLQTANPLVRTSCWYSTQTGINNAPTWAAVAGMAWQWRTPVIGSGVVYNVYDVRTNGVCWIICCDVNITAPIVGSPQQHAIYSLPAGLPATATGIWITDVNTPAGQVTYVRSAWNGLYWNFSPGQDAGIPSILGQSFLYSAVANPTLQAQIDTDTGLNLGLGSIVASSWGGQLGGT